MLLAEKDVKDTILGTATPKNYQLHLTFTLILSLDIFTFLHCIDLSNSQDTVGIILVKHSLIPIGTISQQ